MTDKWEELIEFAKAEIAEHQGPESVKNQMKLLRTDFLNHTSNLENEIGIIKGYFNRIQSMLKAIFNQVKLN